MFVAKNQKGFIMEKIEYGIMIMKNSKAWGVDSGDGQGKNEGWVNPCDAKIYDPRFVKKPTDVTYKGSFVTKELEVSELVQVQRQIKVIITET